MPAHNLIHGGDVYTAMENGLERPLDFSANIGRWVCRPPWRKRLGRQWGVAMPIPIPCAAG